MREINNNTNNLNFSGVQKIDQQKENSAQAQEIIQAENFQQNELQDLSQMPSAVTGRSLVFQGSHIDKDLKFLMENPEFVEKANKFFDVAAAQSGYENAAKLMEGFVKEFQN